MYENVRVLKERHLPLEIRFVGETMCDEKYIIKRKHSEIMSLEYIVDGKGVLEINGQTLYPKKGDVFLLTEGSEHKYYCDKSEPWHKYFVSFSGPVGKSLIESYIPPDTYLFDGCFIEKSFERIFDIAFNNDDFEKIQSLGGVELFKIFNCIFNRKMNESEDLADKIKKEIESKITEEFNLEKLAKSINYSKNHIINIFSAKFGITPYQYYKDSKIALAKEYLINSKMTVGEIANTLAYSDQQYFSYSFKKETGYSPKKYREIMKV